jgi:hypothetical protein
VKKKKNKKINKIKIKFITRRRRGPKTRRADGMKE